MYGFIDKKGNFVIEPKFDSVENFSDGLAIFTTWHGHDPVTHELTNKYGEHRNGVIDKSGNIVIPPKFGKDIHIRDFKEGLAVFRTSEKKSGYIDKEGKIVIEPKFDIANDFGEDYDGFAKVVIHGKFLYINHDGEYDPDKRVRFSEDFYLEPIQENGKYGYRETRGNHSMVVNPIFEEACFFSEGIASVKYKDKCGYIDKTGNFVIEPIFDKLEDYFHEGLAYAKIGDKWGFIDKTGNFYITPKFEIESVGYFSEGLAAVKIGGKWGFIDRAGDIVIKPEFDNRRPPCFKEGLASVAINDIGYEYGKYDKKNWCVRDKNGKYIWDTDFEYVLDVYRGYYEGSRYDDEGDENKDNHKKTNTNTQNQTTEQPNESKNVIYTTQVKSKPKGGCYIASSVYGSYNCPQVWTLRRFRDNTLDETWYGRAFIKTYYAISPTLVKWFGETNWFKKLWRKPLDKLVASLKHKGVEDTPYQDKY